MAIETWQCAIGHKMHKQRIASLQLPERMGAGHDRGAHAVAARAAERLRAGRRGQLGPLHAALPGNDVRQPACGLHPGDLEVRSGGVHWGDAKVWVVERGGVGSLHDTCLSNKPRK